MSRRCPLSRFGCAVAVAMMVIPSANAQTTMTFEVASVRESAPREPAPIPSMRVLSGRVQIQNAPLPWLISTAYRTEPSRLVLPAGVPDRRFDITATIPEGGAREKVPEMLQALLQDRFGLNATVEMRKMAVYELTQRAGGHTMVRVSPMNEMGAEITEEALGTKILGDRVSSNPDAERRRLTRADGGFLVLSPTSRYELQVTLRRTWKLTAARMSISELITELRSRVDRPVVDGTGLAGLYYRFETELPFELLNAQLSQMISRPGQDGTASDPMTTSSTTAHEAVAALGLKLEARELFVPVLAVNALQQEPSAN